MELFTEIKYAIVLSCLISYTSAFVTFSFAFKDRFRDLFLSWEAQFYSLLGGALALFVFNLTKIINISIAEIKLNDHPLLIAVFVGIAGHRILLSIFKSKDDLNSSITQDIDNFYGKTQRIFFHSYAVKRNLRLHDRVSQFMSHFPYAKINELTLSCQIIAKEIDEEDCERLVKTLTTIISYDISGETKVINIGLELSKYLGPELIEQISKKVLEDNELNKSIESASNMLKQIKAVLQE